MVFREGQAKADEGSECSRPILGQLDKVLPRGKALGELFAIERGT
jgi:hypothetical protein